MTNQPLRYEWTGNTAEEAKSLLSAAEDLISGHMKALAPGDAVTRYQLAETARVGITITLDLSDLVVSTHEVQALNAAMNLDPEA